MNLLIYALLLFIQLRTENYWLRLILLIASMYYLMKRKEPLKYCIIFCFVVCLLFLPKIQNEANEGKVIEHHSSYAIASFEGMKVLVMSDESMFPGDKVVRISAFSPIETQSNFNLFNFKQFYNRKGIYKMLYKDDFVLEKADTLQRQWYEKCSNLPERVQSFVKMILYQECEADTLSYLMLSSGLHYSSFSRWCSSLLSDLLHLYSYAVADVCLLIFSCLFGFSFSMIRVLLSNLLQMSHLSKKDQCGAEMLILMICFPSCVYESAFLLPMSLKFFNLFNLTQIKGSLYALLILPALQCRLMNGCNLFEIVFFGFYSKMNLISFLLAVLIVLIPALSFLCYPLLFIYEGIKRLPEFALIGHMYLGVLLIYVALLLKILTKLEKKTLILMAGCMVSLPFQAYLDPFYEVTMLNVGQGDCFLLRAPLNQANVLIDIPAGFEGKTALNVVVPYLKSKGIYQLDALILTHDDKDHSGGKEALLEVMPVEQVIEQPSDLNLKGIELRSLNPGGYQNENADSLVYAGSIGQLQYLFMADVPMQVEEWLIEHYELHPDILKVAHHGSSTSTSPLFIQSIQPRLALISASAKNRYKHPHPQTLATLSKYGVEVLNTAVQGAVSIKSFLNLHFITTSEGEFGIIVSDVMQ